MRAGPRSLSVIALAALATAAALGLVFALWAENGAKMFAAMVEAGLALCF